MPKVTINKAFHFREGAGVKRYIASEEEVEVSQAVADHAKAHGFLDDEKPAQAPKPAQPVQRGREPQPAGDDVK
ncbi:hypothetical protein QO207_11805 [Pseudomonas sp. CAN2814]|uniref:hypothetical protein n=1 Tax=Pseudomonas sp. CAN1 TaxID=3046726 RepID=UPI002647A10D|nr:hypothetical protein [Pseudomonas sp. CAN1]MDN6857272.1 hypothetical protein [Pseudomonas sp. CAN1]